MAKIESDGLVVRFLPRFCGFSDTEILAWERELK